MKIEEKELTWLKPLQNNVRHHNENQVDAMIKSIKLYGVIRPIVSDEDGNILCGNCLYTALSRMGQATAPTIVCKNLSETQKKKLVIVDNRISDLGFTKADVQVEYLKDILKDDDMDIPGFDSDILTALQNEIKAQDEEMKKLNDELFKFTEEDNKQFENTAKNYDNYSKPTENNIIPTSNNPVSTNNIQQVENQTFSNSNDEYIEIVCPHCGKTIKCPKL